MKVIIFDTETTGIPKHPSAKMEVQPRVIELAALLVDEHKLIHGMFDELMDPEQKLEEVITKVTGLKDSDLDGKPTFEEWLPTIEGLFREADVAVAHNLPFDYTMVNLELARLGRNPESFPWPRTMLCTVQEHFEEFGRRVSLKDLFQHYYGRPLEQKHRALEDVYALKDVCVASDLFDTYKTLEAKRSLS